MAQEIEKIQNLEGVRPVTAGKLIDAGYDSVEALAVAPVRELVDKANLEASTAVKILKAARQTIQLDARCILLTSAGVPSSLETVMEVLGHVNNSIVDLGRLTCVARCGLIPFRFFPLSCDHA